MVLILFSGKKHKLPSSISQRFSTATYESSAGNSTSIWWTLAAESEQWGSKRAKKHSDYPPHPKKTRICPIPLSLQVSIAEFAHLPLLIPLPPLLTPLNPLLTHPHFCPSCYESKEVWSFCDNLCGLTLRTVFSIWDKLYCSPFFPYPAVPCIISAECSVVRHFSWIMLGLLGLFLPFWLYLSSFTYFTFLERPYPSMSLRELSWLSSLSAWKRTYTGIELKR